MGYRHESVTQEKSQGEKRTAFVVIFSAITMVLEIIFGLFSNSMALLATLWRCLPTVFIWARTYWR